MAFRIAGANLIFHTPLAFMKVKVNNYYQNLEAFLKSAAHAFGTYKLSQFVACE